MQRFRERQQQQQQTTAMRYAQEGASATRRANGTDDAYGGMEWDDADLRGERAYGPGDDGDVWRAEEGADTGQFRRNSDTYLHPLPGLAPSSDSQWEQGEDAPPWTDRNSGGMPWERGAAAPCEDIDEPGPGGSWAGLASSDVAASEAAALSIAAARHVCRMAERGAVAPGR